MQRGSDKHSRRVDEALRRETESIVRTGREGREEWKAAEPSGEDEPDVDLVPNATLVGGTPEGMDPDDVEGRSELARYLGKDLYPAVREQLIGRAIDENAPAQVVDRLRQLPSGRIFATVSEVWTTLGGHVEDQRF